MAKKDKIGFAQKEFEADILPKVLMEIDNSLIDEANKLLNNFLEDMGVSRTAKPITVKCSEEALKVMEEANRASEDALRAKFRSVITEINPQKQIDMEAHII